MSWKIKELLKLVTLLSHSRSWSQLPQKVVTLLP